MDIEIEKLIPKNKFDQETVDKLEKLSFDQLRPIVPQLLEWLQDMNWPIARPVADILEPYIDKIIPEIIKIFKTDDGMWKYWMVIFVRNTTDPLLIAEIERIAKFPTRDEIEDEVDLLAIEILSGKY